MSADYQSLVSIISRTSGLNQNEIEERVKQKVERISGMISKDGAARIVAAELGVNFDSEKNKINELVPGMRRVNVLGKVISVFPVRTFSRNGKEGKVANLIIADETSNIRVVLWDINHIRLVESGEIANGIVVEISNANMRENEIHLGSFCEIKVSDENIENVKTQRVLTEKKISDFKISDNVETRAFIVQVFEPKFFNVCSKCGKKVVAEAEGLVCAEHGKDPGEKRVLMNLVLDDGTGTIRAVLFQEQVHNLGFKTDEIFEEQKNSIMGKEMVFSGVVRMNKYFNNPELIVNGTKEVDVGELLEKLEKR